MGKPRHRNCNEKGCHKARERKGFCADHFSQHFGKKAQAAAEAAPAAAPEAPAAE
jgi:hypothetical protein